MTEPASSLTFMALHAEGNDATLNVALRSLASSTGYLKEAPALTERSEAKRTRKGIGGHQSARMISDVWLTPPEIVKALGPFDLDPCAPSERPWDTARWHITPPHDGLSCDWKGRVWLNPPYGSRCGLWLAKLAAHGDGIAIIFARTETRDWQRYVWSAGDAILFVYGRLHFYRPDGTRAKANSGAPSALIAYGQNNVTALRESGISGAFVTDWRGSAEPLSDNQQICGNDK